MPYGQPIKPKPDDMKTLLLRSPNVNTGDLERLWTIFLFEMLTLFYPPFRAQSATELLEQSLIGLRAYLEDLCTFPDEILSDGWRDVRRSHRAMRWPTPGDVRRACLVAEKKRIKRRGAPDTMSLPFWQRELSRILEPQVFRCWIRPLEIVAVEDDLAILAAPTSLHASWNRNHYASLLLRHVAREYPQVTGLEITVMSLENRYEAMMPVGALA